MTRERRFISHGNFGFIDIKTFKGKGKEYDKLIDRLDSFKEEFFLIYSTLDERGKKKLKGVFKSNLTELKKAQEKDLFRDPIQEVIQEIEKATSEGKSNTLNLTPVKWIGTKFELIELIKSLVQTDVLESPSEKETVKSFEKFFNFKLKNYSQNLNKISERVKEDTPFIDTLKVRFSQWIKDKKKKRDDPDL